MRKIILLLMVIVGVSSCRLGLDELPLYEETEIIKAWGLKREVVTTTVQEKERTTVVQTKLDSKMVSNEIDAENKIVSIVFEEDVDLTNIIIAVDISRGAIIEPLEDSNKLGIVANWTNPQKYLVTAANNDFKKEWTITISKN
ncbi:hypothetical protein EMN47_11280 [Prolixibacteraceae bacterium JC049]|nr:hypothetical protein [Prolixibacteraceae bacterium JC049]